MDMEETLTRLEFYLREGFCLHGSQRRVDILQPRQATCSTGRPEGNLNAIYASPDDVQVPIIMALLHGNGHSSYTGNGEYLHVKGGRTFAPGFVYVLPTETFVDEKGELVSYVPVSPHLVVSVTPSILWPLLARGTLGLEIAIPSPW